MKTWIALIGALVGGGGMAGMYLAVDAGAFDWWILAVVAAGLMLRWVSGRR